jgi:hypothetical protein
VSCPSRLGRPGQSDRTRRCPWEGVTGTGPRWLELGSYAARWRKMVQAMAAAKPAGAFRIFRRHPGMMRREIQLTSVRIPAQCRSLQAAELLPGNETAHPIRVTRDYPPASLTYAMASHRTTARAHSAIAGTHTGRRGAHDKGTRRRCRGRRAVVPRSGRIRQDVAACGGTPPLRPDDVIVAGFLRHADHLAGRLIAFPWRLGELDNTLITVMSGTGAEGHVSDETKTEEWS